MTSQHEAYTSGASPKASTPEQHSADCSTNSQQRSQSTNEASSANERALALTMQEESADESADPQHLPLSNALSHDNYALREKAWP